MRPRLGMLLFLVLLVSVGLRAQNDPMIATWKLNLPKSKYNPGPPPKSPTTMKITAAADGIRVVTDGVNAQGQTTHSEYTAKFDGKDYPTESFDGMDVSGFYIGHRLCDSPEDRLLGEFRSLAIQRSAQKLVG